MLYACVRKIPALNTDRKFQTKRNGSKGGVFKVIKVKFLCSGHEYIWGSGDLAPLILNLGTSWR